MKAVLDEGVPRLLIHHLPEDGCEVDRFPNAWKGMTNGALLDRLEQSGFGCLIACDKNLQWQQALRNRALSVVIAPDIALAVKAARAGEISHVPLRRSRAKT